MKNICLVLLFVFPTILFSQAAFDFSFTNAEDSVEYTLYEDFLDQGKTIFIDFFHTRCPSCRPYTPLLEPLYQSWGSGQNDVEFIALSTQSYDSNASVAAFQEEEGHTFLSAGKDGGSLEIVERFAEGEYGPFLGTPTFVVIAPDGTVNWRVRGQGVQGTITAIDEAIAATGAIKPEGNENEVTPVVVTFTGEVKNGDTGVNFVQIKVAENNGNSSDTNINGQFSLAASLLPESNYHLEISKNGAANSGVTTFDLVKIRKHILGTEAFDSPWQYLAADANESGTVTTSDLIRIQKVILGIGEPFPDVPNWRFVPADHVFPNPVNPLEGLIEMNDQQFSTESNVNNLEIRAVKMGDVNFSATN